MSESKVYSLHKALHAVADDSEILVTTDAVRSEKAALVDVGSIRHAREPDPELVWDTSRGDSFPTWEKVWIEVPKMTAAEPVQGVDATLEERGSRYGCFEDRAEIVQDLKDVMYRTGNWESLKADQREALDMIQHKISRILNGDADDADSWHDISGYATLVESRLNGVSK